jgi:hypothetical protein
MISIVHWLINDGKNLLSETKKSSEFTVNNFTKEKSNKSNGTNEHKRKNAACAEYAST